MGWNRCPATFPKLRRNRGTLPWSIACLADYMGNVARVLGLAQKALFPRAGAVSGVAMNMGNVALVHEQSYGGPGQRYPGPFPKLQSTWARRPGRSRMLRAISFQLIPGSFMTRRCCGLQQAVRGGHRITVLIFFQNQVGALRLYLRIRRES